LRRLSVALDPELVDRALEEATKRAENLDYFFENLSSPEWIEPLATRGFFSDPPEQRVDEQGYIRAPGWSASRYLARMAPLAPEAVLKTIRQIDSNNERIHEDFEDAALAMPPEFARVVADLEAHWISSLDHIYYSLPRKTVALIGQLATAGEMDAAVKLFHALFVPMPDRRDSEWVLRHAQSRFTDWEYDDLLGKAVAELLPVAPLVLLRALVDLLNQAILHMREDADETPPPDRLWRTRVASDEHRAMNVEDSLVSALRDVAVSSRERGLLTDEEISDVLLGSETELLRRIFMHALSREPRPAPDVVRPLVMDVDELVDAEPSVEFRELLRAEAGRLTSAELAQLLAVIDHGPDVDRYRELAEKYGGRTPTDEDVAAYVARWQVGRLRLLEGALPPEWEARRAALVEQVGDYEIGVSGEVRSFVGPTSPATEEQLSSMGDDKLVAYLEQWTSDGGFDSPSVEGLARAFSVFAERNPTRASVLIGRLRGARPAYVQWALHGLEQAVQRGARVSWSDVLELAEWIVQQPRERPGGREDDYDDLDPGWVWTRRAIASLVEAGLESNGDGRIDFSERDRVWRIIAQIASDPDPTPEDEERYGGTNMDPATLALNTTRPRAIHAAIAYAVWVFFESYPTEEARRAVQGAFFREVPEVGELLATHADPTADPSEAVRGAIGQHLSNLYALDEAWSKEVAHHLFPNEDSPLREAAWGSFVIYNAPYNNVLVGLRDVYLRSAELAGASDERFRWMNGHPREKLGEHIATFYWRGVVGLNDKLFETYWSNTTPEARSHVVEFLGRSAREFVELESDIVDRLTVFWEKIRAGDDPQPLRAFAWWFPATSLPREWRLRQLASLLEARVSPEPGFLVAEALPDVALEDPREAVRLFRRLLELQDDRWVVDAWRERIENVLDAAFAADDTEARRVAEETANWLGARGYREFRRFVG
jgi:hypothetical protein